jgi:hypothetical protein
LASVWLIYRRKKWLRFWSKYWVSYVFSR